MKKIDRPPAPDFLKNNYKQWGIEYKKAKDYEFYRYFIVNYRTGEVETAQENPYKYI